MNLTKHRRDDDTIRSYSDNQIMHSRIHWFVSQRSRIYRGRRSFISYRVLEMRSHRYKGCWLKCICTRKALIYAYKGDVPLTPPSMAEPLCDVSHPYIPNTSPILALLELIPWALSQPMFIISWSGIGCEVIQHVCEQPWWLLVFCSMPLTGKGVQRVADAVRSLNDILSLRNWASI